jgi:hypothetical protein
MPCISHSFNLDNLTYLSFLYSIKDVWFIIPTVSISFLFYFLKMRGVDEKQYEIYTPI